MPVCVDAVEVHCFSSEFGWACIHPAQKTPEIRPATEVDGEVSNWFKWGLWWQFHVGRSQGVCKFNYKSTETVSRTHPDMMCRDVPEYSELSKTTPPSWYPQQTSLHMMSVDVSLAMTARHKIVIMSKRERWGTLVVYTSHCKDDLRCTELTPIAGSFYQPQSFNSNNSLNLSGNSNWQMRLKNCAVTKEMAKLNSFLAFAWLALGFCHWIIKNQDRYLWHAGNIANWHMPKAPLHYIIIYEKLAVPYIYIHAWMFSHSTLVELIVASLIRSPCSSYSRDFSSLLMLSELSLHVWIIFWIKNFLTDWLCSTVFSKALKRPGSPASSTRGSLPGKPQTRWTEAWKQVEEKMPTTLHLNRNKLRHALELTARGIVNCMCQILHNQRICKR